jgi:hypothetical protein
VDAGPYFLKGGDRDPQEKSRDPSGKAWRGFKDDFKAKS